jgi:hypothetical protein
MQLLTVHSEASLSKQGAHPMCKRVMFVILMGLCLSLSTNKVNSTPFKKIKAAPIPKDQFQPISVPPPSRGGFCLIQNDDGIPVWYAADFDSGIGIAVFLDPEKCGVQIPYPFKITDVHLYLEGSFSDSIVWPVMIQVSIKELMENDECQGPGNSLFSQFFLIPADSDYSYLGRPMNLGLAQPVCTSHPFFLEVEYKTKTDTLHPLPGLLMDSEVAIEDSCDNWGMAYGMHVRWTYFWLGSPPGDAIIHATGYTQTIECDSCWYWKPDRPSQTHPAPSGMPDFGQYQFSPPDSMALSGPTALANGLWWLDAVPLGMNPPQLIQLLSDYFHTRPDSATLVDSIQKGLDRYFQDYGFYLYGQIFFQPQFYQLEDSLERSKEIILLLGFWQFEPDLREWFRFGGHFVTMSGVCSESLWVGLSDPARDAAEYGWTGRVRPNPHPSHPQGDTLHNHPQYISHDIYQAILESPSPGGFWSLSNYPLIDDLFLFEGRNFQPGQGIYSHPFMPSRPVFAEVEYAVMILSYICGDANGDGNINSADVAYLINYLFVSGPPPNPLWAGDTNSDGNINSADVAYLINYLFVNGPEPRAPGE